MNESMTIEKAVRRVMSDLVRLDKIDVDHMTKYVLESYPLPDDTTHEDIKAEIERRLELMKRSNAAQPEDNAS